MNTSGATQVKIGHMVVLLYLQPRELGVKLQRFLGSEIVALIDSDSTPDTYRHIKILTQRDSLFGELLGARVGEALLCRKWEDGKGQDRAAEIQVRKIIPLSRDVLNLLQTPQRETLSSAA